MSICFKVPSGPSELAPWYMKPSGRSTTRPGALATSMACFVAQLHPLKGSHSAPEQSHPSTSWLSSSIAFPFPFPLGSSAPADIDLDLDKEDRRRLNASVGLGTCVPYSIAFVQWKSNVGHGSSSTSFMMWILGAWSSSVVFLVIIASNFVRETGGTTRGLPALEVAFGPFPREDLFSTELRKNRWACCISASLSLSVRIRGGGEELGEEGAEGLSENSALLEDEDIDKVSARSKDRSSWTILVESDFSRPEPDAAVGCWVYVLVLVFVLFLAVCFRGRALKFWVTGSLKEDEAIGPSSKVILDDRGRPVFSRVEGVIDGPDKGEPLGGVRVEGRILGSSSVVPLSDFKFTSCIGLKGAGDC